MRTCDFVGLTRQCEPAPTRPIVSPDTAGTASDITLRSGLVLGVRIKVFKISARPLRASQAMQSAGKHRAQHIKSQPAIFFRESFDISQRIAKIEIENLDSVFNAEELVRIGV